MDPFNSHPHLYAKAFQYAQLILQWSSITHLVSTQDAAQGPEFIIQRHFIDSCQLSPFIPCHSRSLADVGSGAGFPGLVLALLGHRSVTLIERDTSKCLFLSHAIRALQLSESVTVQSKDSLSLKETFDVVTSRAVGSLGKVLDFSRRLLHPSSLVLILKSQRKVTQELQEAEAMWQFEAQVHPHPIYAAGCIVGLSSLQQRTRRSKRPT